MIAYVLILWYSQVGVTTQEFGSERSCEVALQEVRDENSWLTGVCVRKNE